MGNASPAFSPLILAVVHHLLYMENLPKLPRGLNLWVRIFSLTIGPKCTK